MLSSYLEATPVTMETFMTMTKKPFRELTTKEAETLVRSCIFGAKSNDDAKCRLTNAGFNGAGAIVTSTSTPCGRMTMMMGMVRGPKGEIISF